MPTMEKEIRAILFDLDGTLVDTEKLSVAAWYAIGEKYGYSIPPAFISRTRGQGADVGRQVAREELGEDFPYDRLAKEQMARREEMVLEAENLAMSGARALLEELRARGMLYTLVTSRQEEWGKNRLKRAHLDDLFGECIWRECVEKLKPDPEALFKGAEVLGVRPEECLMVGDTLSDVRAAAAAGMQCAFVKGTVEVSEEIARTAFLCDSVTDILKFLPEMEKEECSYRPRKKSIISKLRSVLMKRSRSKKGK